MEPVVSIISFSNHTLHKQQQQQQQQQQQIQREGSASEEGSASTAAHPQHAHRDLSSNQTHTSACPQLKGLCWSMALVTQLSSSPSCKQRC
jgi:hypothetical protein